MKKNNYKNGSGNWHAKICVLCVALMLCIATFNSAKAAVNNYTFATTAGTYTPIVGTTLFSGTWDDSNSALLTIPFSFSYNGSTFTTLGVCSNGFIRLGALTSTVYCGLQTSGTNSIAGYATDLNGNAGSTVQYATTGIAPNRQFVIQWTDCKHFFQTSDHYSFQIILNETSNEVQVVWGPVTAVTATGANTCQDVATESGNVGLKGASNADFNIRSVTNGTNTWPTSVNGGVLTAVCNMSSTNFPALGLTYTWTPPVPAPMVYASSTTVMLNNGEVDGQGSNSHQILQVQVVTTGNLSPIDVTSLVLSTAGCTNPGADISNAKVYFTGLSGTYSAATQFGTTTTSPNGTYTLNGTATLSEGTNFFWVDYSISPGATIGNSLTGCCTQITGNGSMGVQVPTITCPAGAHTVGPPLGYWTPVANTAPSASGGVALVLSDGTVMCKSSAGGGGIGNVWNKLTPDASGSYANGTWTTLAPMISTRLYFSSQVLKDGSVYVAGGEYGTGLQQAETYNPLTNIWTAAPSPGVNISDANSEILEDGRILQACVTGNLKVCKIYDPVSNTFAVGPSSLGIHNESAWVKLPDNSILMVDRLATTSERYIPSLNTWVADGTVPVALYDPFGDETGGALLLPDGRAFFIGSLGHNAYYTPSGNNTPGVWAAAPDIPGGLGVPDGAAAMMVNGRILLACSPIPTSGNHFPPPTSFFEFDYLTNTFLLINTPFGGTSTNMSCYITNMTALPDGNILYSTQGSSQYYLYTPGTAQLAAGKPVIGAVTQTGCGTYNITGTQFNGISQGGTYGDDWQMATNYPIIRLTNGSNVYYCRSANWNSTGVQRGLQPDNAQFTLPAALPPATYQLVVTANGITSNPVTFIYSLPVPVITGSTAICGTSPTTLNAGAYASYLWSTSATTQTISVNTAGTITVTVTDAFGCTGSTSVTTTVNPTPTPSITGTLIFCSGSSTTLDAGVYAGYNWSTGASSQTISVNTAGTFTVTVTDANGCTGSTSVITTVNPTPTPAISGVLSFCSGSSTTLDAGAGYSNYNWSTGATSQTISVNTAGTFTVTVTDALGCTGSSSVTTTINPTPTATISGNTSICAGSATILTAGGILSTNFTEGFNSGTINVDYTPAGWFQQNNSVPGLINWFTGNASVFASHSGAGYSGVNYQSTTGANTISNWMVTPTLTLQNGDVFSFWTRTVDSPAFPDRLQVRMSTNGSSNNVGVGTAAVGDFTTLLLDINPNLTTSGYPNTWTQYSATISGLSGPTSGRLAFRYFVTNGGPTGANSDYIGVDDAQYLSNSSLSYNWSTGATTQAINVSAAGTFTVTVTNSNGCTSSTSVTSTVNPLPTPSISGAVSFCSGSSTTLDAGAWAGYNWSTGETIQTISVNTAGTFTVTVTDANGCTGNASVTTTVNALPTPSISGSLIFCSGSSTTLDAGSYTTYNWSSGATTQAISANTAGTFTVTVTNANGCTASASVTTIVNALPTPSINGALSFCDGSSTALDAGNYAGYVWSNGASTQSIVVNTAATFTVTVTNANGCTASASVTTIANALPTPSINGALSFCDGSSTTLDAGIHAGYVWSNGATTQSIVVNTAATFTVTVTNANGCTASAWVTAIVNPLPVSTISGTTAFCSGGSSVLSANAGYSGYLWSTGETTSSITVNTAGLYAVTFTNALGCTSSSSVNITVYSNPSPVIAGHNLPCNGTPAILNAGSYTSYAWSTGASTQSIAVTTTGTFTATVTNANGCTGTASYTVNYAGNAPAKPATMTGSFTANCVLLNMTYSCSSVANATSYFWTVPVGVKIISGQGSTSIVVNYTPAFTANNGVISVSAVNSCGMSAALKRNTSSRLNSPVIAGSGYMCPNDIKTYTVVPVIGATSYTWTKVAGSVILSGQGTATVTIKWGSIGGIIKCTANNGCGASIAATNSVSLVCAKVAGISFDFSEINLYPNPASTAATVQFNAFAEGKGLLTVYDLVGQQVLSKPLNVLSGDNQFVLDLNALPKGIYNIRVDYNGMMRNQKLVVQ